MHNRILTATALLLWALSAARAQVSLMPNSWTMGTPMPTARNNQFVGVIGNKIYVIGGQVNSLANTSVNEIYDPFANSWTTGAAMPTARHVGASAVVGNILYAIGGIGNAGPVATVEAYDPAANIWSTKASMPAAIDSMYAVAVNNVIYVVGGFNPGGGRLATLLSYNPAANIWSVLASLNVGKSNAALGVFGSMIVSASGLANSDVITDTEGYSVANNTWTTLASAPTARNAPCYGSFGNTLYLAGGNAAGNLSQLATMDAYNAGTNSWATGLPSMPNAIAGPASASFGGSLYCFGGANVSNPSQIVFSYVQIYQPPLSPPAISSGGVISASGFGGFSSIAPGSWIEIYGSNLASGTRSWAGSDFNGINAPTSLDGTSVTVGGQAAFVDYISPGQVNALVPSTVGTGFQPVTVTTASGTSAAYTITVNAVEPGLLALPSFNINGTPYAVAFFADGTFVLPTSAIAGITSRPAKPGDVIVLYGVGFGPVAPYIPAGQLAEQATSLASSFQMSIGGAPAVTDYDGLAPSYTGLYQFNVTVPTIPAGNAPVTFAVGGTAGTQTLYLSVGN
jgi:uncharacterized protein (TIGR03437 family)